MKNSSLKFIFILLLIIAVGYWIMSKGVFGGVVRGVKGVPDPIQKEAKGSTKKKIGGYDMDIQYLYSYDIEALVVHDEDYDDGSLSGTIAPKDVALAWGPVAEYNDRIDFNWEQSNRWYYWHVNDVGVLGPVGGEDGVSTHSANTHLIPADSRVKDDVMKIKQGDHIKLTGYLVNVDGSKPDGQTFYWYSSTTRDDTGDGACEVMYVESVRWLD
ncbi:MAG: hypothetical protein J5929_09150 [Eubacterium sp.]|nr:hypothetical protein [Eubacterium sp.]